MTPNTKNTNPGPEPVVRWIFLRGGHALTCEVDVTANGSYDVFVMPHWDVPSSVIEHFEAPTGALLRHAEIARRLRETGWVLTDHVAAYHTRAAA
jgi:hypothetical protein